MGPDESSREMGVTMRSWQDGRKRCQSEYKKTKKDDYLRAVWDIC